MTAQVLFSMFFSQKDPGLNAVEEFDQIIKRFKKKTNDGIRSKILETQRNTEVSQYTLIHSFIKWCYSSNFKAYKIIFYGFMQRILDQPILASAVFRKLFQFSTLVIFILRNTIIRTEIYIFYYHLSFWLLYSFLISLSLEGFAFLLGFYKLLCQPQITAQKMKFFIKDFFSKCDQICRNLRIWSHLLKKSLIGNFSFCAVIASSKMTSYLKMLPVTKICFRHIIQTAITWANQVIWSSVLNSSQLRPLSTL